MTEITSKNMPLDNNEDNIGYLLWRITKIWQRERQRALDEFNTTTSQLELLGCIMHLEQIDQKEVTQILLSQEAGIDPMTTSTILRNLEKKGMVIRTPSKIDTRARIVNITEEGIDLFTRSITKLKKEHEALLKDIDTSSMKLLLQKILTKIEENVCN